MSGKEVSQIIQVNFGKDNYERALSITDNIRILFLNRKPLEIRCIIFEKDLIFHLIINEKKLKIYHDCPSVLFNQTFTEGNICLHFIKLFLLVDYEITKEFLSNYNDYTIMTSLSEILEEKLINLYLLMEKTPYKDIEKNQLIELFYTKGLNHLKGILNHLIKHHYFTEFFSLLEHFSSNNRFNEKNISIIKEAPSKLIAMAENYSFLSFIINKLYFGTTVAF